MKRLNKKSRLTTGGVPIEVVRKYIENQGVK